MEDKATGSSESSKKNVKIDIANKPPSPNYLPTVNLMMMQMVVRGKVVSAVIIQRHDSHVPGENSVWIPLQTITATQAPQIIIMPGMSRN